MSTDPGAAAPPPHAQAHAARGRYTRRLELSLGDDAFARFGGGEKRRLSPAPSASLGLAHSSLGLGVPSSLRRSPSRSRSAYASLSAGSLRTLPARLAFRTPSASSTDHDDTAAESDTTLGSALEIEHTLGSDTETERGSDNDDDFVEQSLASLPLSPKGGAKGKGVDPREYGIGGVPTSSTLFASTRSIDMLGNSTTSRRARSKKRVSSRPRPHRRDSRTAAHQQPNPAKSRPLAHLAKRRVVSNGSVDRLTLGMIDLSTSEESDAQEVLAALEPSPSPVSRVTTPIRHRRDSSGSDADEESDGERSRLAHKRSRRRIEAQLQLPTPPPTSPSQLAELAAQAGFMLVPISSPVPRASGIKRSNSHLTSPDVTPTRPRLELAPAPHKEDDEAEGEEEEEDYDDETGTVRFISSDLEPESDVAEEDNDDDDEDDAVAASSDLELNTAPPTPTPAPRARTQDSAAARTLLAFASSRIAPTSARPSVPISSSVVQAPKTPPRHAARIRYQKTVPGDPRKHGEAQIVSVAESRRPAHREPPARAVAHDTRHLHRASPTSLLPSREKSHRSRSKITRVILAHAQRTSRRFLARVKEMDEVMLMDEQGRLHQQKGMRRTLHTWRYTEEARPVLSGHAYVDAMKQSKTAQQARSALLRRYRSKRSFATAWAQNDETWGATSTAIMALDEDEEVEKMLASPGEDVEMFDSEQVDAALGLLAFSASALPSSIIGKRQRASGAPVEAAHRQQRRRDLRGSEVAHFLSFKVPYLAALRTYREERREAERAAVAEALRRTEEAAAAAAAEELRLQAEHQQNELERVAEAEAAAAAEAQRIASEFNRTARAREDRTRIRPQPYNTGNESDFRARIREQRFANARRRQEAELARSSSMEQDRRVRAVSLPAPARDEDEDDMPGPSGSRRHMRLGSPLVLEPIADADEVATQVGSDDDEPMAGPSRLGAARSPVRPPAPRTPVVAAPRTPEQTAALQLSPPPRYELPVFPVLRGPHLRTRREAARLRASSDPPRYARDLYRTHSPPPPPPYNAQVDGGCVMPPVFVPEAMLAPREPTPPRPGPSTTAMAIADRRAVDIEVGEAGPGPSTLAAWPSMPLVPGRYVADRPQQVTYNGGDRETIDYDALDDDAPQSSLTGGFLSRFLPRWW